MLKEFLTKFIIIVCIFAFMLGGCSYLNKKLGLRDDNIAEQSLEEWIELHSGLEIDLTPED